MHIFTARVHDGRLVILDPDPASLGLKEGDSIDLVAVDELLLQGGALSEDDERAALHRAIEVSLAEEDAGMVVELDEVLRLEGQRAAAERAAGGRREVRASSDGGPWTPPAREGTTVPRCSTACGHVQASLADVRRFGTFTVTRLPPS
ncbi:MAG TPA: hypothetical protein VF516_23455 [Kofleriaceae bacterium]